MIPTPPTFSKEEYPPWSVIGLLPHGSTALYVDGIYARRAIVKGLTRAVRRGTPFLGRETVKGYVLILDELDAPYDEIDMKSILSYECERRHVSMVVIQLSDFKAVKKPRYKNTHKDYFAFNRLAVTFKVTILILPEIKHDALDFAVDTIITFKVPTTADDRAPMRFKVEARDVKPVRGLVAIHPKTGKLSVVRKEDQ